MMILRWFVSSTLRQAVAMKRQVQRLLNAQRDLMPPPAVQAVEKALAEFEAELRTKTRKPKELRAAMGKLEGAANKWIKPYPHAVWRENVEVLLVALAVAMGIRTFFLQPFKIPTGSMQPTLFGVTSVPDFFKIDTGQPDQDKLRASFEAQLQQERNLVIPSGLQRLKDWIHGISYVRFVAPVEGQVEAVGRPWPGVVFSLYQKIKFAGEWHTIWFPPDYGEVPLEFRTGLKWQSDRVYHKGEDVFKIKVKAGDHLFVDRLTYNFRPPTRGEIVVFDTTGISNLPRDQQGSFYIKRLVGLGGEHLVLRPDYEITDVPRWGNQLAGHLEVNGNALSASTPHFENVYSFSNPPVGTNVIAYADDRYFGHALMMQLSLGKTYDIPPKHSFVMGDNTFNSSDSRFWGDFPDEKIIGKSFFVYWPLTKRFGFGNE